MDTLYNIKFSKAGTPSKMEGDGMIAVVRGLNDSSLCVTLLDQNGQFFVPPNSASKPAQPNTAYVNKRSHSVSNGVRHQYNYKCDTASQAIDGRYATVYKTTHCHVVPTSPSVESREFPPQRPELCKGYGNFRVGDLGSGEDRISPTRTSSYRAGLSAPDRGRSSTSSFANSLRKYPSMSPERSVEIVERLINYTQTKHTRKQRIQQLSQPRPDLSVKKNESDVRIDESPTRERSKKCDNERRYDKNYDVKCLAKKRRPQAKPISPVMDVKFPKEEKRIQTKLNQSKSVNIETQAQVSNASRAISTLPFKMASVKNVAVPPSPKSSHSDQYLNKPSKSIQTLNLNLHDRKCAQTCFSSIDINGKKSKQIGNRRSKSQEFIRVNDFDDEIVTLVQDFSVDDETESIRGEVLKRLKQVYDSEENEIIEIGMGKCSQDQLCKDLNYSDQSDEIMSKMKSIDIPGQLIHALNTELQPHMKDNNNKDDIIQDWIKDIPFKNNDYLEESDYLEHLKRAVVTKIKAIVNNKTIFRSGKTLRNQILNLIKDIPMDFSDCNKRYYLNKLVTELVRKLRDVKTVLVTSEQTLEKKKYYQKTFGAYNTGVDKLSPLNRDYEVRTFVREEIYDFINKFNLKISTERLEELELKLTEVIIDSFHFIRNGKDDRVKHEVLGVVLDLLHLKEQQGIYFATNIVLNLKYKIIDIPQLKSQRFVVFNYDSNNNSNEDSVNSINEDDIESSLIWYTDQVVFKINEWIIEVTELNPSDDEIKTSINELAGDIVDRQKYIDMNPSNRGIEDEIEHLKYQIFKSINKYDDHYLDIIEYAPELMQKIKSIPVPMNTKTAIGYENILTNGSKSSRVQVIDNQFNQDTCSNQFPRLVHVAYNKIQKTNSLNENKSCKQKNCDCPNKSRPNFVECECDKPSKNKKVWKSAQDKEKNSNKDMAEKGSSGWKSWKKKERSGKVECGCPMADEKFSESGSKVHMSDCCDHNTTGNLPDTAMQGNTGPCSSPARGTVSDRMIQEGVQLDNPTQRSTVPGSSTGYSRFQKPNNMSAVGTVPGSTQGSPVEGLIMSCCMNNEGTTPSTAIPGGTVSSSLPPRGTISDRMIQEGVQPENPIQRSTVPGSSTGYSRFKTPNNMNAVSTVPGSKQGSPAEGRVMSCCMNNKGTTPSTAIPGGTVSSSLPPRGTISDRMIQEGVQPENPIQRSTVPGSSTGYSRFKTPNNMNAVSTVPGSKQGSPAEGRVMSCCMNNKGIIPGTAAPGGTVSSSLPPRGTISDRMIQEGVQPDNPIQRSTVPGSSTGYSRFQMPNNMSAVGTVPGSTQGSPAEGRVMSCCMNNKGIIPGTAAGGTGPCSSPARGTVSDRMIQEGIQLDNPIQRSTVPGSSTGYSRFQMPNNMSAVGTVPGSTQDSPAKGRIMSCCMNNKGTIPGTVMGESEMYDSVARGHKTIPRNKPPSSLLSIRMDGGGTISGKPSGSMVPGMGNCTTRMAQDSLAEGSGAHNRRHNLYNPARNQSSRHRSDCRETCCNLPPGFPNATNQGAPSQMARNATGMYSSLNRTSSMNETRRSVQPQSGRLVDGASAAPKKICCNSQPTTSNIKAENVDTVYPLQNVNEDFDQFLRDWVQRVPIAENPAMSEHLRKDLYNGIWIEITKLKLNPEAVNNPFYYQEALDGKIDDLFDSLPQTEEFIKVRNDLKNELIDKADNINQFMTEAALPSSYKQQLIENVTNNIPRDPNDTNNILQDKVINHVAENFIIYTNYNDTDPTKANVYKNKMVNDIHELVLNKPQNLDLQSTMHGVIHALERVPKPSDEIINKEAVAILLEREVEEWFSDLPLHPPADPKEIIALQKHREMLAKKLYFIENSNNSEQEMKEEIKKFLNNVAIRPCALQDTNFMVDELQNRLQNRPKENSGKTTIGSPTSVGFPASFENQTPVEFPTSVGNYSEFSKNLNKTLCSSCREDRPRQEITTGHSSSNKMVDGFPASFENLKPVEFPTSVGNYDEFSKNLNKTLCSSCREDGPRQDITREHSSSYTMVDGQRVNLPYKTYKPPQNVVSNSKIEWLTLEETRMPTAVRIQYESSNVDHTSACCQTPIYKPADNRSQRQSAGTQTPQIGISDLGQETTSPSQIKGLQVNLPPISTTCASSQTPVPGPSRLDAEEPCDTLPDYRTNRLSADSPRPTETQAKAVSCCVDQTSKEQQTLTRSPDIISLSLPKVNNQGTMQSSTNISLLDSVQLKQCCNTGQQTYSQTAQSSQTADQQPQQQEEAVGNDFPCFSGTPTQNKSVQSRNEYQCRGISSRLRGLDNRPSTSTDRIESYNHLRSARNRSESGPDKNVESSPIDGGVSPGCRPCQMTCPRLMQRCVPCNKRLDLEDSETDDERGHLRMCLCMERFRMRRQRPCMPCQQLNTEYVPLCPVKRTCFY